MNAIEMIRDLRMKRKLFLGTLLLLFVNLAVSWIFLAPVQGQPINGEIIQQELDASGNGYTVMKVWGTYYEMGYAHGYLLADDIDATINSIRNSIGSTTFNNLKPQMQNTVIPSDVTDEVNGIVAGIKAANPSSSVDFGDIIMFNTYSDWGYSPNCRSHSAWGSYVTPPVKTLSTRRTDYSSSEVGSLFDSINILFLAYKPSENGKIKWTSLGMPGLVIVGTGVNEYGTLLALHDSSASGGSHATGSNVMTRSIATRHMMTMNNLPTDVSQQVDYVYNTMQDYKAWTGSYLNYYAPEGNAGVLSLSASEGFYNLRKPQPSYYGGHVIVTSNQHTDGLSTPSDFLAANSYYNNIAPKTIDDHWGLLDSVTTSLGAQQISVEYRGHEDMTIWFRGRLLGTEATPIVKLEWSELFEATPPQVATVSITTPAEGATFIEPGEIMITADASVPGETVAEVSFYANETTLIGMDSTDPYSVTWNDVPEGTYSLTAIARDSLGGELMTSDPVAITVYSADCITDEDCTDWNTCTVDTCIDGVCQNECDSTVISYPNTEGFESGWGDWVNDSGDDMDWTRNSGSTPSRRTGPSGAHGGSYYIFTEASAPNYPAKKALLVSPCFDLGNTTNPELTFWYHMYGSAMGSLNLEVSEDCENWTNVWSMSGDQGNAWHQAIVDLTPYTGTTITIRIAGSTGSSYRSDISIDHLELTAETETSCGADEDCNDGNFCNGAEICVEGLCQAGTDPCPGQSCDEDADACVNCLVSEDCDDGLYCNGEETCVDGQCQPGSAVDCDDGVACTDDSCNESNDSCDNVTNDAACDDGVYCNGVESCSAALGCQAGSDPCPGNYCDEATNTCYEGEEDSECEDGLFCNGTETCVSGVCQFSSDPCPGQGCDEDNDECVAGPVDQMHVNTIEVTKKRSWFRRRGMARVQIVDTQGSPVEGAVVAGRWSGGASDTDQVSTGSDGWANIYSDWRWGDATFTFCVTNVSKEGWGFDPVNTCGNTN